MPVGETFRPTQEPAISQPPTTVNNNERRSFRPNVSYSATRAGEKRFRTGNYSALTPAEELRTRRTFLGIMAGGSLGLLATYFVASNNSDKASNTQANPPSVTESDPIPAPTEILTPVITITSPVQTNPEKKGFVMTEKKTEVKLSNGISYLPPVEWTNSGYYTNISQLFGENRQPGFYSAMGHSGIDLVAGPTPDNTNSGFSNGWFIAPVEGIARLKNDPKGFGQYIEIISEFNGKSYIFRGAHLSQYLIKDGETVTKGQRLGEIGSTGASTGNHLHFDIRDAQTNKYIDPFSPETSIASLMNDFQRAGRIDQLMFAYKSPMYKPRFGEFMVELGHKYNIDPALVLAIMTADTSMYKWPSVEGNNNPANVGNTDSCPTCMSFATIEEGVENVFKTLVNKYLGDKKSVGELSVGGYDALGKSSKDQKIYASSTKNWNDNVTTVLEIFYGLTKLNMPEEWVHNTLAHYNFRIYS